MFGGVGYDGRFGAGGSGEWGMGAACRTLVPRYDIPKLLPGTAVEIPGLFQLEGFHRWIGWRLEDPKKAPKPGGTRFFAVGFHGTWGRVSAVWVAKLNR
jgi:hypothetical protein